MSDPARSVWIGNGQRPPHPNPLPRVRGRGDRRAHENAMSNERGRRLGPASLVLLRDKTRERGYSFTSYSASMTSSSFFLLSPPPAPAPVARSPPGVGPPASA